MIPVNSIICGEMPKATKVFPNGYFNCSISSPPYWALRDYGVDGQLGLEPTFEEYIDKLCTIYDEVKRVLRKDGTCWVNLGDTYGTSSGAGSRAAYKQGTNKGSYYYEGQGLPGVKNFDKSLCLIPQRFAIEMVNRGWILRNVIVWHKPNPMPSSAKDRFTVDFEYVYFFVKSKKYWFEPQYEPVMESTLQRDKHTRILAQDGPQAIRHNHETPSNPLGRNKRCVWTIPTQPYPEAHFATFPEKLVEPMIKAGCPEFVCTKCGKAREKIWDTKHHNQSMTDTEKYAQQAKKFGINPTYGRGETQHYFKGYTDCGCNADWRPGRTLDCFRGHGYCRQGGRQVAA